MKETIAFLGFYLAYLLFFCIVYLFVIVDQEIEKMLDKVPIDK